MIREVQKPKSEVSEMIGRKGALGLAALALSMLALAGCGVDAPTKTPTSVPATTAPPTATPLPTATAVPLEAVCISTEAYPLDLLMAVSGEEQLPSRLDAVNSGGCDFSRPVVSLLYELLLDGQVIQSADISLAAPASNLTFPLPDEIAVPIIDALIKPGQYERRIVAAAADGDSIGIGGLEPVLIVGNTDSVQAVVLKNQARWARSTISTYTYTTSWHCFCMREYVAPVSVEVADGRVVDVNFIDPSFGEVPEPARFVTIEGLFDHIQDALDRDAFSIAATYDDQLGYPTEVFVDYDQRMVDEELGFSAGSLRAR